MDFLTLGLCFLVMLFGGLSVGLYFSRRDLEFNLDDCETENLKFRANIMNLRKTLNSADKKVTELEDEVGDLHEELAKKDARIAELEKELEKAQRNDMPQDPETGKFVSKKKTATKKKATAKKGK